jgi:hypothetical protein
LEIVSKHFGKEFGSDVVASEVGLDLCGIFFDVESRAHVDVGFFVVVCAAERAVLGLGEFFE